MPIRLTAASRALWRRLPVGEAGREGVRQAIGPLLWRLRMAEERRRFATLIRQTGRVPGPVRIAAMFSAAHGIASSAVHIANGLRSLGIEPELYDLGEPAPGMGLASGSVEPGGAWIIVVNAPEMPWALARLGAQRLSGAHICALWVYELEELPSGWRNERGLAHQLLAPSHFAANAISRSVSKTVTVTPFPMSMPFPDRRSARQALGLHEFTAVTMFDMRSSAARKNPKATIDAFKKAFGDDAGVKLIVKMQNGGEHPAIVEQLRRSAGPNVEFITARWPLENVHALISGADVLITLHRSEGFGLTVAEAMRAGTPVVATDWSATTDFVDAKTGWPVPYSLIEVDDPQRIYTQGRWADADTDVAAAMLRRIRCEPAEAISRAEVARHRVAQRLAPICFARSLGDRFWDNVYDDLASRVRGELSVGGACPSG